VAGPSPLENQGDSLYARFTWVQGKKWVKGGQGGSDPSKRCQVPGVTERRRSPDARSRKQVVRKAVVGCQFSVVRGNEQRPGPEAGSRTSEIRGRRTEVRNQRSDVRRQRTKVRSKRLEEVQRPLTLNLELGTGIQTLDLGFGTMNFELGSP
jgi:hypothetical protein